jgi:hypothetical protein
MALLPSEVHLFPTNLTGSHNPFISTAFSAEKRFLDNIHVRIDLVSVSAMLYSRLTLTSGTQDHENVAHILVSE